MDEDSCIRMAKDALMKALSADARYTWEPTCDAMVKKTAQEGPANFQVHVVGLLSTSLSGLLAGLLSGWLTVWLAVWLAGWLAGSLAVWLDVWLTVGSLSGSMLDM